MRGNVIGFDPDTNTGAISGFDGNRYDFVMLDWRGAGRPRRGDVVDFQAVEQRATDIDLVEPHYVAPGLGAFYFSPAGRISRSQYWLRFMLPYCAISFALQIAAEAVGERTAANSAISLLFTLFSLVAFWPSIAVLVKRIHDRDKPGWLCLALYVPVFLFSILLVAWLASALVALAEGAAFTLPALGVPGVIVIVLGVVSALVSLWFFIEFGCLRGTIGANRYGPDPVP
ncbi:MAG TPA: DUF805 domain-containing protein [Stellaceae bacterium]|nr:DUF805 domain-containing protein [Stellaceae bacterium]